MVKVTVFVELKARFDEENNLATAEMMKRAGIHIIFSIPGLKVHAKVALVLRYNKEENRLAAMLISVPEISMRRLPGYMLIPVCSLPTRLL